MVPNDPIPEPLVRKQPQDTDSTELVVLRKQMATAQQQVRQLEAKNGQLVNQIDFLKAIQENTERLKEEKLALETKIERLERMTTELNETKIKLQAMQVEKRRWTQFFENQNHLDVNDPFSLARLLNEQQTEIADLKDQLGRSSSHYTQIGLEKQSLEANVMRLT